MTQSNGSAHLRLVVLGGAGAGKTTTANAILGQDAFKEAETIGSSVQKKNISGWCISLIDTPRSLLGSFLSDKQQNGECLEKCLSLAAPGPHAFLLVIPLGTSPVSDEGARVVEWIGQKLGEEALAMTFVLFTRREKVTRREWNRFLLRQEVQHLIRSCSGGYHTMNSKAEVEPYQVTELLEKVDAMVKRSGGEHYMIDKFLQAQRSSERKEEKVSALLEKEERKWGDRRREMEMRKQKREEDKRIEEEDRKRQEEERRRKELRELQERKRQEGRERVEQERRKLEEVKNRQQQERQRLEEEEMRQQEARQRLEEERRHQEEVQQRLEEERRLQEDVGRRLEEERERQEQETQRLVQERRRRDNERQVARGGGGQQQQEEDGWWRIAERCAAVAGSFLAPFTRR